LTSIGLSAGGLMNVLKSINVSNRWKSACIVVSAHEAGAQNKYATLAKEQLEAINVSKVDFVDFFTEELSLLSKYDLVYITGGNTFRLLQSVQQHENGVKTLKGILAEKDIIGVSAGSILLTPTVRVANEVEPDDYLEVKGFDSLGLVPYEVYPHYEPEIEDELTQYEKKHSAIVARIANDGFVLIEG
jgi:dipeptidase E